ncbi:MAG: hypothetical protein K0S08_462 [Gammaproteobacteria bacterium]|jgi:hypothetical protein|nr:hypothetical protein [Gammaproteobacteria bacterium]
MNQSLKRALLNFTGFFLICLPSLLVYLWAVSKLWPYTVDDSYITFRYAQNFATTGIISWNVGQAPIEGYTSFLHMLLMALGFHLNLSPIIYTKVLGITAAVLMLVIGGTTVIIQRNAFYTICTALFFSFFFAEVDTAVHSISGLETNLFLLCFFLLLTNFIYLIRKENILNWKKLFLFGLIALCLSLLRPEGYIFTAIIFLALLWEKRQQYKLIITTLCLAYLLPVLAYQAWHYFYFHQLFPLSFYVKMLQNDVYKNKSLLPGFPSIVDFVQDHHYLILASAIAFILTLRQKKIVALTLFLLAAVIFMMVAKTKPIMNFNDRYIYPIWAILLVLPLTFQLWQQKAKIIFCGFLFLCLLLQAHQIRAEHRFQNYIHGTAMYANGLSNAHIQLGKLLAQMPHQGKAIATGDSGAIPFYSGWNDIDVVGLNERTIATTRMTTAEVAQYVVKQAPQYIILVTLKEKEMSQESPARLALYQAAIQAGYRHVKTYTFDPSHYYLWVLEKSQN